MNNKQKTLNVQKACEFIRENHAIYSNTAEKEIAAMKGNVSQIEINEIRKKVKLKTLESVRMASEMYKIPFEFLILVTKINED